MKIIHNTQQSTTQTQHTHHPKDSLKQSRTNKNKTRAHTQRKHKTINIKQQQNNQTKQHTQITSQKPQCE